MKLGPIATVLGHLRRLRDPKAPRSAKAAAALGILYAIWPVDLLPDVVPALGWADDAAIVSMAFTLAAAILTRWANRGPAPLPAKVG